MSSRRIIPFKITSMDSLGQGVSKESDKITFISKTMVGDEGKAEILAERKGVAFARVVEFSSQSQQREVPACAHFSDCPSCHFLHVPYSAELEIKKSSLEKMFRNFPNLKLEVVGAPARTSYRNRVQLHYDRAQRKLGTLDAKLNRIVPIPQCLIANTEITREIQRLYKNETWLKEAPQKPNQGHLELYWREETLRSTWNRPYAEGGFTQVYETMNQALKERLWSWQRQLLKSDILDLFGGNGNLSQEMSFNKRLVVDVYEKVPSEEFISQNIYDEKALNRVQKLLRERNFNVNMLLLDPPRSGLKDLRQWLLALKPAHVAYVSCDPHTLVRDINDLSEYTLSRVFLLDFFPSTHHFETMVFLERKS